MNLDQKLQASNIWQKAASGWGVWIQIKTFLCPGHYHMQLTAEKCWCSKDMGKRHLLSHEVYVCSLDKNARQHMQTLCRSPIHMVIPLYLNNFFSGALWMPDPGRIWTPPCLKFSMTTFSCLDPTCGQRRQLCGGCPHGFLDHKLCFRESNYILLELLLTLSAKVLD